MEITTLDLLLREGDVRCVQNGLHLKARLAWIVPGERRLSYTTLVRLVECCREYHWITDVCPSVEDDSLDAVTVGITARFLRPIAADSWIAVTYTVTDVGSKSYRIMFTIRDLATAEIRAELEIVSVFIEPDTMSSTAPPPSTTVVLTRKMHEALETQQHKETTN